MEFRIRAAVPADIEQLRPLVEASVRILHVVDYTPEQIACALSTVYGVDSQLVADATYFVAEALGSGQHVGCGGWSQRSARHGGDAVTGRDQSLLDPRIDAARIRAFFVHPDWTRRGVASRILDACESAALAAGFRRFEISATITGAALYAARGYAEVARSAIPLAASLTLPIVLMEKHVGEPPPTEL